MPNLPNTPNPAVSINTDRQAVWIIGAAILIFVFVMAVAGADSRGRNSLGLDVQLNSDRTSLIFLNTQSTPISIKDFTVNDRPECTNDWRIGDTNKLSLMFQKSLGLGDAIELMSVCRIFKARIFTDRGDLDLTFR